MKIRKTKKAQHETAGFVLIVVIVMVAGLVFLGLMIGRGEPSIASSKKISDLLTASMYHTTDCEDANSFISYKNGQELIKSCYKGQNCKDGRTACEVLNSSFKQLITKSLNVHPDSPDKGFELDIYYQLLKDEENIEKDPILYSKEGIIENCSLRYGGYHEIYVDPSLSSPGIIYTRLSICRSE